MFFNPRHFPYHERFVITRYNNKYQTFLVQLNNSTFNSHHPYSLKPFTHFQINTVKCSLKWVNDDVLHSNADVAKSNTILRRHFISNVRLRSQHFSIMSCHHLIRNQGHKISIHLLIKANQFVSNTIPLWFEYSIAENTVLHTK